MSLQFFIDGIPFDTTDEYKTGEELKKLAGIPLQTELYLSVRRPYEDELVGNTNRINLARPEIEYFYVPKELKFTINNTPHVWHKQYITGEDIRKLGQIDPEHEVYLDILAPFEDELVTNDGKVDLARSGMEHFKSKMKLNDYTVIVNGRNKEWKKETINFDEVVQLAFPQADQSPNRAFTVTYNRGVDSKPEGIMVKGTEIRVKDKMIFNVTATDKS